METPTVIIIEDDPVMRVLLNGWLRSVEETAQMFDSCESFLHHFDIPAPGDSTPIDPDKQLPVVPFPQAGCLLLDVTLTGMDGLQLQKLLAARVPKSRRRKVPPPDKKEYNHGPRRGSGSPGDRLSSGGLCRCDALASRRVELELVK
jgi:CheY-like chemotaxis protein